MSETPSAITRAAWRAKWRATRREILIVAAIVLLALGLRLVDLTGESLWYDEAYSVWTSKMEIASLQTLWEWQIEFPLYYLLLHYWMRLFGDGEFSVRALGALTGALSVAPIYLLGKSLRGHRIGILAALLLAVNPYHVWYSQEVRMFSLAVLFAVGSLYAYWRLLRGGTWGWRLVYVVLTGLAFHVHYYIGWLVLAENLLYLLRGPRRLVVWIAGQLGIVVLAFPAVVVFLTKLISHNQWGWLAQRYAQPGLYDVIDLFVVYAVGISFPGLSGARWLIVALFVVLAAVGALGTGLFPVSLKRLHARDDASLPVLLPVLTLGLPLACVFVLGQLATIWVPRHLLLFMPSFLLLVAMGLETVRSRAKAAITVVLMVTSFYALSGAYGTPQKEDWRGIVGYLASAASRDDLIVLMDEECRVPFDYYAQNVTSGDASPLGTRIEVSRFADDATLDRAASDVGHRMSKDRVGGSARLLWLVISHAESDALVSRLDAAPHLQRIDSPAFVGIQLIGYEWS